MPPRPAPELAVSAAIFRSGNVLVVRRAAAPAKGLWTLPGGRVEIGETLVEAVRREVMEETSLTVEVAGLAGYREIILSEAVGPRGRHFVILPFAARWVAGEVTLNDELSDGHWMPIEAVAALPTTEGLLEILRQAERLLSPA
ncbi:NUDIX hydrolase [Bradyrhizobium sp. LHD-71]|uniref:NUDIX hydrolase n=1 Tax=Bradyrhizobium sp. LHD-71 TaxID=3072141 RepID=UPI00280EF056|nr:NUDIX hydrolase [Bradyrhizobium sp. LHD-71]MDQ8731473.1 NUDIX hydrolase [Bradyrhizobium sp. LHD-71]